MDPPHRGRGAWILASQVDGVTIQESSTPGPLAILARLAKGEASVMELAMPFADANKCLERYRRIWEGNFQRLDALLDELKAAENAAHRM